MKGWMSKHLNWAYAAILFILPAAVLGTGGAVGWDTGTFSLLYFLLVVPLSALFVIILKGRNGLWILICPFTLFLFPLFLSNKSKGMTVLTEDHDNNQIEKEAN